MSERRPNEVRANRASAHTPDQPHTSPASAERTAREVRSREKSTKGGAPELAGKASRGRAREQSTLGDRMESPASGPRTRPVPSAEWTDPPTETVRADDVEVGDVLMEEHLMLARVIRITGGHRYHGLRLHCRYVWESEGERTWCWGPMDVATLIRRVF